MSHLQVSHLEDHLGYWLRCLSNYVHRSFEAQLSKYDISVAQWVVLRTLYGNTNITLNQAAGLIGLDKSSLSRMLDRLIQRNLITRGMGNNRRSISINLTPKGEELIPQLAKIADENDREFFKSLDVTRREDFFNTVKQLIVTNGWNTTQHGQGAME